MRTIAALMTPVILLAASSGLAAQTLTPTSPPPGVLTSPPPAASSPPPNASPLTPSPPPTASNPPPAPSPLAPSSPPTASNPPPRAATPPAASKTTITTLTTFNVGNWSGGAYSVAGGTALDHCAGAATYTSGITVAFAVSRDFTWSIGLFDGDWNLAVGTTYPVAFSVDGSSPYFATATAIGANEVDIPLAPKVALFKEFMGGNMLKVEAAQQVFSFKLTNTSELLPDLLRCVEAYAGAVPPSANPFGTPIKN